MQRCSSAAGQSSPTAFQLPGAVGDDKRRRSHPAGGEVAPEGESGLVALPAPRGEPEQDLAALQGDPPGAEDTLGRLVLGAQLQVDRVQGEVDQVVLVEAALAPAPVALTSVLADPRDGRS